MSKDINKHTSENDGLPLTAAPSILFELAEVYPDPVGLGRMPFTFGRPRLPVFPFNPLGTAELGDRGKGRTSLTPSPSPPLFLGSVLMSLKLELELESELDPRDGDTDFATDDGDDEGEMTSEGPRKEG